MAAPCRHRRLARRPGSSGRRRVRRLTISDARAELGCYLRGDPEVLARVLELLNSIKQEMVQVILRSLRGEDQA
jgi:hypothetical protein